MIKCNNCGWSGKLSELTVFTTTYEGNDQTYCPKCNKYLEFMVNEHPMLMSTPMIQAYKKGIKTMTRRLKGLKIINDEPDKWGFDTKIYTSLDGKGTQGILACNIATEIPIFLPLPYGNIGDNLWFRETWCNINKSGIEPEFYYFADTDEAEDYDPSEWKWKPSIHMPRIAARFMPKILGYGLERLQNITDKDAIDEGIESQQNCFWKLYDGGGWVDKPIMSYRSLWEKINGKDSWKENPWVWVVKFERYLPIDL